MTRLNKKDRPIRVAYDIRLMSAGGGNGGIKTHHYEFLRHFSEHHADELELWVFCQKEIVEELSFLSASPFNQIHVIGTRGDTDYRNNDGSLPPLHFWPEPPTHLLKRMGVDLLYCGFGESELYTPEIPQIALLVDVLHKDLPEMLPPSVVAHRDRVFKEAIERSALIQTNSKFCIESLKRHYNVPDEKLFHIYLPLHGRFNRVEMGSLPDALLGKKYFFYPANHWPHKNHEGLFIGYRKYSEDSIEEVPDLVCTGTHPEHTPILTSTLKALGIESKTHLTGHLQIDELKAVWEHATALVFPSLYEGFGLPILEALHFQKPIICSDIATSKELAGRLPTYFNPRKPKEIASALMKASLDVDAALYYSVHRNFMIEAESNRLSINFRQTADQTAIQR